MRAAARAVGALSCSSEGCSQTSDQSGGRVQDAGHGMCLLLRVIKVAGECKVSGMCCRIRVMKMARECETLDLVCVESHE